MISEICSVLFLAALLFLGFVENLVIGSEGYSSFICNALLLYRSYVDVVIRLGQARFQVF